MPTFKSKDINEEILNKLGKPNSVIFFLVLIMLFILRIAMLKVVHHKLHIFYLNVLKVYNRKNLEEDEPVKPSDRVLLKIVATNKMSDLYQI